MSAFQSEVIHSTTNAIIRFITIWSKHPQEKGITYFKHMNVALSMAGKMAYGAVCLTIHSFFPFWFQTTGSSLISELHHHSTIIIKDEPDYSAARASAMSVSTPRQ
jgi:hypothetical protein